MSDALARVRKELEALSSDLVKGLQGLTFLLGANKNAQDAICDRIGAAERELHTLETRTTARLDRLDGVLDSLKDVPERLAVLEKIASGVGGGPEDTTGRTLLPHGPQGIQTGGVQPPSSKWRFYVILAFVSLPGLGALILKLLER